MFHKRYYNYNIMNMLESIVAIAVGVISILGSLAIVVGHLVKHYFAELKPNGGSSLKDQVNRLEKQHEKLDSKVDKIYDILLGQTKPTKVVKTKN
jgi:CII-binding regulator of phage lambda lysogenization HflD